MLRYIAFIRDAADPAQARTALKLKQLALSIDDGWQTAFSDEGLDVLTTKTNGSSAQQYQLSGDAGVVLGTLFKRSNQDNIDEHSSANTGLGPQEHRHIGDTHGRHLIDHYWGRYVAFLRDRESETSYVLRDPSGLLPCFHATVRGILIVFSFLPDINRLGIHFSINWDYVRTYLLSFGLHECRETGLIGVAPVLPGECLQVRANECSSLFYWSAIEIAQLDPIEDRSLAARCLRGAVRTSVGSWASCYDSILHKLSGGLDSSIVLACLATPAVQRKITCLNEYSRGADSDEREYAQLAAKAADCKLIELELDATMSLDVVRAASTAPCPSAFLQSILGRPEVDLAKSIGASAIFSGEIGDAIFYTPTDLPAADYVRLHGLKPPLLRIALDVARAKEITVWRVLRDALHPKHGPMELREAVPMLGEYKSFVNPQLFEAPLTDRFLHPWLKIGAQVPAGKLQHIQSMLFVPSACYDPLGRHNDPERLPPLVSQPILEVVLRTPTYVLADGGWDRSIARAAFYDDLPSQIATRRTKGGADELLKENVLRNLQFISEYLLEGVLAREKLIDVHQIERTLSGRDSAINSPVAEWHCYLFTEAWLRNTENVYAARAA